MSRYARAALVVLAVVLVSLVMLHVVAPQFMAMVAHHIHSR